jgi:UDP-N-acetylglucosamine 2-epimerase (hydrolysing)
MYHPVTTDVENLPQNIKETVDALILSKQNYVVIYPNNDHGSDIIINELSRLKKNSNFRIYPSLRFECFLTLLKNAQFMMGNSSAGIREMPFYGLPSINLGNRQENRSSAISILNCDEECLLILEVIERALVSHFEPEKEFGDGNSNELFLDTLTSELFWKTPQQKVFMDI